MPRIVILDSEGSVINWVHGDVHYIRSLGLLAEESSEAEIGQRFIGGQFVDVDAPAIDNQVIALPAHKAKIMLLRAGYLNAVQAVVNSLGAEAIISFERAPEIHSNNALVNAVLGIGGVGLSDEQIYQLFVSAQLIE